MLYITTERIDFIQKSKRVDRVSLNFDENYDMVITMDNLGKCIIISTVTKTVFTFERGTQPLAASLSNIVETTILRLQEDRY